ncbi:MAG: 5'-methylthioadenosine/S-adenosylhomocysteine nucleosidase [Nitrospira sp. CG24C]|nr:MAG: 5'-methylthioadenosine/S-adenosylhomocysteine nucleosidase [Nitrospira sp. CG24C]
MTDISVLMSAVKPRERTDQYVVLSALFALEAHVASVTAKPITDLLKLHLGAKAPYNVNASLRAYKGYVSPKEKGPPLRWSLTQKGVEHLRSLSGLPLSTASDTESFRSDIGIICALEHPELAAVLNALGGAGNWKEVGDARHAHIYREASLAIEGGATLRVVATTSTSMGLTAAAIATTQLVFQFRPRLVAMIGIAAGTRSGGKQFGDILVADPSVDYNSGKVVLAHGIREFQPDPYPISLNPRLRSVLQKYRGPHPLFAEIRKRWDGNTPVGSNRLHVGPVGAADQVIDDPTRVLEIQKNWRKLIGVEMETYGVYRAIHESPEPKPRAVSFKAVCDFAAEKSDSWQEYAAFTAAEFAIEFFRREWASLWPTN